MTFTPAAHADTIYKTVDENGKVSYSSTPPANNMETSEIKVMPPPSDEQIKAAQQQQEKRLRTGEMLEDNRKKRNEITAEENRIKREKQQSVRTEESSDDQHYGYPYIPGRRPGRPAIMPPIHRPVLP